MIDFQIQEEKQPLKNLVKEGGSGMGGWGVFVLGWFLGVWMVGFFGLFLNRGYSDTVLTPERTFGWSFLFSLCR